MAGIHRLERIMDCYHCRYGNPVIGSAHMGCKHPLNDRIYKSPEAMITLLKLITDGHAVQLMPKPLNLKLSPTGIKGGWCTYPFDFDPIWILNCDGYTHKDG